MKKVNSLSGGKTSSYLAVKYPADYNVFSLVCINDKRAAPKDPFVVRYVEDKLQRFVGEFGEFIATAEDDNTLQVMIDIEQLIGKEITWVRGMSFDDVIDKGTKTRLPSWARRYCTEKMKLLPIFTWWLHNIGERCIMRVGFRFDEVDRMLRFFNNSDPTNFSIPVSCSLLGQKRQIHQSFNWRFVDMPLVRDGIKKSDIDSYWKQNAYVGGGLFDEQRKIDFPAISNCIGCFHKSIEGLAAMSEIHPEKFRWFIDQEGKGMGRWLDEKVTYQQIYDHREDLAKEVLWEIQKLGTTCDTSGCTD